MHRIFAIGVAALVLTGCSSAPRTYVDTSNQQQATDQAIATPAYPGWHNFDDWHVKALHGHMDLVSRVRLFTTFYYSPSNPVPAIPGQHLSFGFEIFGDSLVVLNSISPFDNRAGWPYCDYDLSSLSVDESKVIALTSIANPGGCKSVALDGEAVKQMLGGKTARVKLGRTEGTFFLDGFKEAWAKARELGKKE